MPYYYEEQEKEEMVGHRAFGGLMGGLVGIIIKMVSWFFSYFSVLFPAFVLAFILFKKTSLVEFWLTGILFSYLIPCLIFYLKGLMLRKQILGRTSALYLKILLFILIFWIPCLLLIVGGHRLLNRGSYKIDDVISVLIILFIAYKAYVFFSPNEKSCPKWFKWAYLLGSNNRREKLRFK